VRRIPTPSQTVGPFFSIGLAPLYQKVARPDSSRTITVRGTVFDGDRKPIPDAVLEFWSSEDFARVPTSEDGTFSVTLSAERGESGKGPAKHFEVLIFMRGLLKPVYTRMYLTPAEALKTDSVLGAVPRERVATLFASKTSAPDQYSWNIVMQGENETAFFRFSSDDSSDQHPRSA